MCYNVNISHNVSVLFTKGGISMKKIISVLLAALMIMSLISLSACGAKDEPLKMGVGAYNTIDKATDADGETTGSGEVVSNIAAVLVNGDGKIVKCVIDVIDCTGSYSSDGKYLSSSAGFKTKQELGFDYNMVKFSDATLEWFEQAAALCTIVEGKTLAEVKALVADGGKGNDEVINAGCTISISDYIKAIEIAVNSAVESDATKDSVLKIGVSVSQDGSDATEEKDGVNELEITYVGAASNGGKVVAAVVDCLQVTFGFNTAGASTYDTTKAVSTKKQLGTAYNMAAYGADLNGDGIVKEWFEQAAEFEAAIIGKTAKEIAGLDNGSGYGVESLQTAGCTMGVDELVKAAVKAATVD